MTKNAHVLFDDLCKQASLSECVHLGRVLSGWLQPHMSFIDGIAAFHFNAPELNEWMLPLSGGGTVLPEFSRVCNVAAEFYRIFDGLHSISGGYGFIRAELMPAATAGFFTCDCFTELPDVALFAGGVLIYEDGAGSFICRTVTGEFYWITPWGDTPEFVSDSFAFIVNKFVERFVKDGGGLRPCGQ